MVISKDRGLSRVMVKHTPKLLKDHVSDVTSGKTDIVYYTQDILATCKSINQEYHYFNTLSEGLALEQAHHVKKNKTRPLKLAGVPLSVKDCMCVEGVESTAGSRILKGYKPLFNATAIQKCRDAGAIIIGKTSQDEFGFGSFNVNVGLGYEIPLNPFDKNRVTGGSSGGSCGATQKISSESFVHASIAESTGGSIVCPAAFCGVYGLCPTYGLVSRYGLIDYGSSLDKIGPVATTLADIALLLEVIAGYDEKDSTSINVDALSSTVNHKEFKLKKPQTNYISYLNKPVKHLKVGIITEAFGEGIDPAIKENVCAVITQLKKQGVACHEISLPLQHKYGIATYYLLAMCEASTNLAKLCGLRYGAHEPLQGNFNDYFTKVRSLHFGTEAKRRIILGTFARKAGYREAYYLKAAKVRTKIIQEYKKAFDHVDVLITPTMPVVAPTFSEIKRLTPLQNYMMDVLTASPNLAGLPHLTVPTGFKDGLPIGTMLIADHLQEGTLVQLASAIA